ncbi:Alanine dehydrogenase [Candidatus Lokiarchaeum ossiferum]|uniref:Alanine dehydrogenase n=1 Tax=Candidatus Lokiarchaeum ossiferum TaxID=2951803 RepID=A0ABY6HLI1_9ARCH|nr:Alanine dehydrogenase [Candidatus Lokiarchaeum sp. B-35]
MEGKNLLYLSRSDIEKINIPMSEIISTLEKMFFEKGQGRVEMPPKPGIHFSEDSYIHAMPAYIPAFQSAGIKWVSAFPENHKKNLPFISGLLILNDATTGFPIAVMDCTWITAMRTGAATAVAAKYLANPNSSQVGILACGVQGRSNLEALSCVFNIKKVNVYDIFAQSAQKYADEMGKKLDLPIEVMKDPRSAVLGSDIIVTSGPILKNPHPTIEKGWMKEGAFGSAVDFDSYWTGEALGEVDGLFTDDTHQMDYYRSLGYFTNTPPVSADLGELCVGTKSGRTNASDRIITMNLGLALEDMVVASLIYKKAQKLEVGHILPL